MVMSIVIGLIILIRCIFDSNENNVYIVAVINIVAIAFVICTIIEKTLKKIICKIEESAVPQQIIKREIYDIKHKVWKWTILTSIFFILIYLRKFCTSIGNDVISILALGISILDDEIVEEITQNYKI